MREFSIIAAISKKDNGIGKNGNLPWNIKEDLQFFQKITKKTIGPNKYNAIIMGRNTFYSLNNTPLPGRLNICISSDYRKYNDMFADKGNIKFYSSLQVALDDISNNTNIEKIFVIGGELLYNEAILHEKCNELFINEVNTDIVCDRFFPTIDTTRFELLNSFNLCKNVDSLHYLRRSNV